MLRAMMVIGMAGALAACATPYQRKGFRGGYEERNLGNGRWIVSFDGNAYTSRTTVMEYNYRRAAELCPTGFDVVDADRSTTAHDATFDNGQTYQRMYKPGSSLVVQCRFPPAPPPTPGHWCTVSDDGEIGGCSDTPGRCEQLRAVVTAQRLRPCGFQQQAICAPSGCFPTAAACASMERYSQRDGGGCVVR